MAFSTAYGNEILNSISDYTMSLHTADPGGSGTNGEISGGGYARQTASFGTSTAKTNTNTNTVTFSSLNAATISYATLWVASVAKYTAPLSTPFTVAAGESIQFSPGDLTQILT